jgi:hypothetical protein
VLTVVTAKPELSDAGNELVLPGIVQAYIESPIYARTNGYVKSGTPTSAPGCTRDSCSRKSRRRRSTASSHRRAPTSTPRRPTSRFRRSPTIAGKACSRRRPSRSRTPTTGRRCGGQRPRWSSRRAECARLNDLESFKHVLAPFDGVVTARNTDVGYLINAGQAGHASCSAWPTSASCASTRRFPRLTPRPPGRAEGTAALRRATRQELSGGYGAHVQCPGPAPGRCRSSCSSTIASAQLFPGSYTEIHFKLPSSTQTLRLPANTILFPRRRPAGRGGQNQDTIKIKKVDQGRDFGKTVEILTGLDPNDAVVVNPPDSINDGMRCALRPPPPQKNAADQGERARRPVSSRASGKKSEPRPRDAERLLARSAAAPCAPPYKAPDRSCPGAVQGARGLESRTAQDAQPRGDWWRLYAIPSSIAGGHRFRRISL